MSKTLLIIMLIVLSCPFAWSQSKKTIIKGYVVDRDSQQPLVDAMVVLLRVKDSSHTITIFTKKNGGFILDVLSPDQYRLGITFMGYSPASIPIYMQPKDTILDLGKIFLHRIGVTLKTVEIIKLRAPIVFMKDTLEYDAKYYKTRENSLMEDLLRKLPGIQVHRDGSITVNGERVDRILIDGKPFFGTDLKLATRNLSADLIDKVQLVDRNLDQVPFTKTGGDNSEKVINIVIKKEKKGEIWGRATAAYGTNDRFSINASFNRFSEGEQISVLGNTDNINNLNFLENNESISGGSGITRQRSAGFNYSRDVNKQLKINASYSLTSSATDNTEFLTRQNLLPDTAFFYNQALETTTNNTQHYIESRLEYTIDSLHTLSTFSTFNFTENKNSSSSIYRSLNEQLSPINDGFARNAVVNTSPSLLNSIYFSKKFRKQGRGLNAGIAYRYNDNNGDAYNNSQNRFELSNGEKYTDTIDQRSNIYDKAHLFTSYLTYTEAIRKSWFLEFGYSFEYINSNSNRRTFDFNNNNHSYDQLNDSLSNVFGNTNVLHLGSLKLISKSTRYEYRVGMNLQYNIMNNENRETNENINHTLLNLTPFAAFRYLFKNNYRLSFQYSGNTQPIDIHLLQPVPDVSNPVYVKLGNPNLKPSFVHSFSLKYEGTNKRNFRTFLATVKTSFVRNKIVSAAWMDSLGRQVSQPLNINGPFNTNANISSTIRIGDFVNINASSSASFAKDVSYINNTRSNLKNISVVQNLTLNYTHTELFDLSSSVNVKYNSVNYDVLKYNSTQFLNCDFSLNSNINLPLGINAGSYFNYTINTGRKEGFNQRVLLINLALSKNLFSHEQGLVKLQVCDLLNQNRGVIRSIGLNYIEDVQAIVLQRFFILSFSWLIKPGEP